MGVFVACAVIVFSLGCGGGNPNVAPVTGTVTLDGQPLADATVLFNPMGEEGSFSSGGTDANGKYELTYSADQKGAWIGQHTVIISKVEEEPGGEGDEEEQQEEEEEEEEEVTSEPTPFNGTSKVLAEVKAGDNTLDFALTSEGS